MVNKAEFMCYIARVKRTEESILNLEKGFDGIILRECGFYALSNYTDKITFLLLGYHFIEHDYDDFYEAFADDFWEMVDNGSVWNYNEKKEKTNIKFSRWEEFYDYWVKKNDD